MHAASTTVGGGKEPPCPRRTLINKGADPDQTDNLAGLSARDYAVRDSRNPAMVALFKDAPKKVRAQVSGPRL